MMWGYGPGMGWLGALMGLGLVAFWVTVVVGMVVLIRLLVRPSSPPPTAGPETTLADRFARGEIDADEYRDRLATLRERSNA